MPPHPYFTAFKVGMTVGTAIFDRMQPDPLDEINNKLSQLMAATTKILEDVGTLKALNYKTTLSHHRTSIQSALEYSERAQAGGDVDEVDRATQNAKEGSLNALRALTNLVNDLNTDEIPRAAIIPLLITALATRVKIIRELDDGATANLNADTLDKAVEAIRKADSDLYSEFEENVITYAGNHVQSGDWHTSIQIHHISGVDPIWQTQSYWITPLSDAVNWLASNSANNPGPRDTKRFLDWGDEMNVDIHGKIASLVRLDLNFAGYKKMQTLLAEVEHLTSGEWLLGGPDADQLISFQSYKYASPDMLEGRGGSDTLKGGGGNDLLRGGDGDDVLEGGRGDDIIYGGADDDSIYGGAGRDTAVFAAASPDIIVAKAARGLSLISVDGSDFVADDVENFAFSDRTLSYEQTAALAAPVLGSNLVFRTTVGSVQSESIDGFEGPDWVEVGHGDDLVDGGKGDDVLIGGAGHDVLMGDLGNDRLVGQDGDDILAGGQGADLLIGGAGHDILMGDSGNDRLFGQDGNDVLNGGDGDDALHGDGDNDTLIGLGGADTLYGGDGDDNLSGNAANDIVYGGDGNDVLNGGDGNDVLNGGTGGDIIDGGAGIDQASYKFSSAGVAINPALGVTGAADLAGNVAFVTAVFNNLFGRDPNGLDTNGGADNYWVAELEAGADIGQINLEIMGGALGDDLAFLEKNAPGVTINLELGTASGGEAEGDNLISIENIGGSIHADILTGDANENRLLGNGGNDTLSGGAGIDQLIGGSGDDILEGGADADQFVFGTTWGNDIVSDFEDGADLLDLSRTSLAFTDLTIIQVGDHAMVADGDGNSIRLDNIDFNNISETDFIW